MNELGHLERVELREIWRSEASDFTPWLARTENLKRLGQALEMELELEAQEKGVGPFRADILCRDMQEGTWVLIENQLERTDHIHLGQLLTYTAGLDAATVVWIAQRFTDEHRAALDWLNEKTPNGFAFFGLEIELWRIGNSPAAPKFNIVSRPNEWTRSTVRTLGNPERAQNAEQYWSGVLAELKGQDFLPDNPRPMRKHDMKFPVSWQDFWLKAYFSTQYKKLGVWVSCRGPAWEENYSRLRQNKADIEAQFREPLEWWVNDNSASLFYGIENADPTNRDDWARQHKLLAGKLATLYHAVNPLIREMEKDPDANSSSLMDNPTPGS